MSELLQVVGSPRRRQILRLIWDQEARAGEIHRAVGDVTFGAVSQQLRILAEAGAVESRREGRTRLYRARKKAFGPLEKWFDEMWNDALTDLKSLAEEEHDQ